MLCRGLSLKYAHVRARTHRYTDLLRQVAEQCQYFKGQTLLFVCPGFNGSQFPPTRSLG